MATNIPSRPRFSGPKTVRISIIASEYNEKLVNALIENTEEELTAILSQVKIEIYRVPGAFEIPAAVEHHLDTVKKGQEPNAIICLGVLIRGKTLHADLVAQSVTNALQEQAVRHTIPLINEVLLVDDKKQAYARCVSAKLNRGVEAARSAMSMVQAFHNMDSASGTKISMRMHPSQA